MTTCLRVRGGVAVRRVVATERPATLLACPQMNPLGADLHTLFALTPFRMLDTRNSVEMRAG